MKRYLFLLGLTVSGCAGGFSRGDRVDLRPLQSGDSIRLSEIIQNIRCDASDFITDNPDVKNFSIGGTIVAKTSIDKAVSNDISGSVPVAPTIEVALGGSRTDGISLGIEQTTPLIVYRDYSDQTAQPTDCKTYKMAAGTDDEFRRSGLKLRGPILDLKGLRGEIEAVPKGWPRVRLPGFRIRGSIYFIREKKDGGRIKVLFVSGGADSKRSSSYRVDFELATKWEPLVADYVIEPKAAPSPPQPTIVYVLNSPPPKQKEKTNDKSTSKAEIPPYDPIQRMMTYGWPEVERPPTPEEKEMEASKPKPDVPK